ncbi:DUF6527 family protein [Microbacterium stercoris]|uniref:Ammonia monooxygenase n=1 Tax=Microbacterium stercoris TaxID=2820289 RepID=A0A939TQR9_9MICO|nr:DUF6527 family protein [Microbacterium stercoris]MBO3663750.1 hypothetical protein [Microbacterium stercoris]
MTPRVSAGEGDRWLFWCPGCDHAHVITVPPWTFDGDRERPTVSPSVLVQGVQWAAEHPFYDTAHAGVPEGGAIICHSFVRDGRIEYLNDSTHALAGQTVDLPDWPPRFEEEA